MSEANKELKNFAIVASSGTLENSDQSPAVETQLSLVVDNSPPHGKAVKNSGKDRKSSGVFSDEDFNVFWNIVAPKHGKQDAKKAFMKIRGVSLAEICEARANYQEAQRRKGAEKFIKWASGWLNDRRWEDELELLPDGFIGNESDLKIRDRMMQMYEGMQTARLGGFQ